MAIKVAINGYGRIGRNILKALYESGRTNEIQIVAINDLGDRLRSISFANKSAGRALNIADYLAYYSQRFAVTALGESLEGRTPYLDIAQGSVETIMKLGEKFEPNPEYRAVLARWRAASKSKKRPS